MDLTLRRMPCAHETMFSDTASARPERPEDDNYGKVGKEISRSLNVIAQTTSSYMLTRVAQTPNDTWR